MYRYISTRKCLAECSPIYRTRMNNLISSSSKNAYNTRIIVGNVKITSCKDRDVKIEPEVDDLPLITAESNQSCTKTESCTANKPQTQKSCPIQPLKLAPQKKKPSTQSQSCKQDTTFIPKQSFEKFVIESLHIIRMKLNKLEKQTNENAKMLQRLLQTKNVIAKKVPKCLPFKSIADLIAFDKASEETYNEVINYLEYLGGSNVTDAAARYIKNCLQMEDDLLKVTWCGSRNKRIIALNKTRFSQACEDALSSNTLAFERPNNNEYRWAMTKGLKSAKERLRRKRFHNENEEAAQNDIEPPIRRQRLSTDEIDEKNNVGFVEILCNGVVDDYEDGTYDDNNELDKDENDEIDQEENSNIYFNNNTEDTKIVYDYLKNRYR